MASAVRTFRNYGRPAIPAISIMWAACYNPHVNGTSLPRDQVCTKSWVAVVHNSTTRIYDLYVGAKYIGSADARSTSRTIVDPSFGLVTPTLREAAVTRDQKGPRIGAGALTMACE
jgi:hypothetical protein